MWENLARDLRQVLRSARREPGYFTVAVLVIGLGIGANTAIFSIVNPLLLRPLPFEEPERLVWIANTHDDIGLSGVTSRVSNLRDYRELSESFEALTGYNAFFEYGGYNLLQAGEPERLVAVQVARDFLEVLGVSPAIGRNFVEEESSWNGAPAVILSHAFWLVRFGGDPGIVGRTVVLNEKETPVVGVLPASFDFQTIFAPATRVDIFVPFPITDETDRWGNTLAIVGRLRSGASIAEAQAELDAINRRLKAADPARWGLGAAVTGLQTKIAGPYRRALFVLTVAVGVVLLIACTNLSNLMLVRFSKRRDEMGLRRALGASSAQLLRQMLTESLVLSFVGAAVGVLMAIGVTGIVTSMSDVRIPMLQAVAVDGTALLYTGIVAVFAGLLFGAAPALQFARGDRSALVTAQARGSSASGARTRLREMLVMAEVTLAFVLLVCAGLLFRSFLAVLDVDLGFRPDGVIAWEIEPGRSFPDRISMAAFHERLAERVRRVPGIDSVGLSDTLPLGRNRSWSVRAKGEVYAEGEQPIAFPRLVDHGYLRTMGIQLLEGRDFAADDTEDKEPVVVVNLRMAQRLWPGRDAPGQILLVGDRERRVIGVVENVRHASLEESSGLEMYLPITQVGGASLQLVVRSSMARETSIASVRAALREAEPALPTEELQSLQDIVDRAVSPRRFVLALLGAFAAAALLLASLGLYGVLSFAVAQRSREIGIRMALGASASEVRRRVVLETLRLTGVGVLLGLTASFVASRGLASMLYGIPPSDALTYTSMTGVLVAVSFIAAYLPARRASRVEPSVALRAV